MFIDINSDNYIPSTFTELFVSVFKHHKISLIILLIFIVFLYTVIFSLTSNNNMENPAISSGSNIVILGLEIVLWVFLIMIIYVNIKNSDKNDISFSAKLKNLFNMDVANLEVSSDSLNSNSQDLSTNSQDLSSNTQNPSENTNTKKTTVKSNQKKEVFHVANNIFTYDEAENVCKSYNASLATYEQIENAYNNGANWCSYGWSDDQLGLFPIQKQLYNSLKKLDKKKYMCGRQGINGGYIANKNMKLGVNCYGVKPNATQDDKNYMHIISHITSNDSTTDSKSSDENGIDNSKYIIAPFNDSKW